MDFRVSHMYIIKFRACIHTYAKIYTSTRYIHKLIYLPSHGRIVSKSRQADHLLNGLLELRFIRN